MKRTMTSPQCFAHERRVFDVVTLDGDLLAFLDECGWNVVFAGSRDGFLLFGALDDVVIPDEKSEGGRSWTNKLKKLCLLVCVFVNLFVRVFVCLLICFFVSFFHFFCSPWQRHFRFFPFVRDVQNPPSIRDLVVRVVLPRTGVWLDSFGFKPGTGQVTKMNSFVFALGGGFD